jgi:hypothetical protein
MGTGVRSRTLTSLMRRSWCDLGPLRTATGEPMRGGLVSLDARVLGKSPGTPATARR